MTDSRFGTKMNGNPKRKCEYCNGTGVNGYVCKECDLEFSCNGDAEGHYMSGEHRQMCKDKPSSSLSEVDKE